MIQRSELLDRLYEIVLELTMISRTQLDMLLENPDRITQSEILRSLVVGKAISDCSSEQSASREVRGGR